MVVAVLVNQFAPSIRGLRRSGPEEAAKAGAQEWATSDMYDGKGHRNLSPRSAPEKKPAKQQRPFRAMAALTSLASDLDIISDWLFYRDSLHKDRQYRANYEEDPSDDALPYLIPPMLLKLLLAVCIAGTFMWLTLATDGRVLTPLLKHLGVDKVSMGYLLFLCVMVEDLPQVVLTFIVSDYYEDDQSLSNYALVNLSMSVYDTLIKLAEAYDERNDVVETGVWCKKSIRAHSSTVTSVLALPLPPSTKKTALISSRHRLTFLQRAMKPVSTTELSRVCFLTTSNDKTIRLWDTSVTMAGKRREHCMRTFCGHLGAVTCVALLEKAEGYETLHPEAHDLDVCDEEHDHNTFFITACRNGNAKLWNLHGDCIRSFYLPSQDTNGITSVTVVKKGVTFVCGHEDGTARLWEAWSGFCIGEYKGHSQSVASLCSLDDEMAFLTGSEDETIKQWNTTAAMQMLSEYNTPAQLDTRWAETAFLEEKVCNQTFLGHSGAVLALACVERGHAFVSGSADGTARLWSIRKGFCLRIFSEHHGPIRSVASLDQVTFLTGSDDTTVKLWNALSGKSLRTYEGHTDQVTGVSVSQDDTTFLTSSADCTVKVWVLTAIPKEEEEGGDLDDLLDLSDFACARG
jgi:WD40 repeat protein